MARPNSIDAAVVDVACADGKLSRLGVPTFTAIAGWCGRSRRTTRLITTAAAWARNAPAPAVSHARRRCGLQQRAERRDAEPADAVLTEMRESPRARQHARPIGERRLDGDQSGLLAPRGPLLIGFTPIGLRASAQPSPTGSSTVSHFCLLVSTGSASR